MGQLLRHVRQVALHTQVLARSELVELEALFASRSTAPSGGVIDLPPASEIAAFLEAQSRREQLLVAPLLERFPHVELQGFGAPECIGDQP